MKVINSKNKNTFLLTQLKKSLESFIGGKIDDCIKGEIDDCIKSVLNKLSNTSSLPIKYIPFKLVPWAEIKNDWHIYLEKIPETKSLGQELFDYLSEILPEKYSTNYSFITLDCANCKNLTIYDDVKDIPIAYDNKGTLNCPVCETPWLTYSYENS